MEPFWGPLGRSWGALGRPWGALGDPWGVLGALLGALGVLLGALGALLGALEPLLSALGVLSGLSWVPLAPNGGPQSSWIRFSTTFCHYFFARWSVLLIVRCFFCSPVCVVHYSGYFLRADLLK